jgi:GDPmannose 4,6-dehydratase
VDELCGDASKAREDLGWRATTGFRDLVRIMVEADLADAGLDPSKYLAKRAAATPSLANP